MRYCELRYPRKYKVTAILRDSEMPFETVIECLNLEDAERESHYICPASVYRDVWVVFTPLTGLTTKL